MNTNAMNINNIYSVPYIFQILPGPHHNCHTKREVVCLLNHYVMKTYGGVEVKLNSRLSPAINVTLR